jgi:hypothetical protein
VGLDVGADEGPKVGPLGLAVGSEDGMLVSRGMLGIAVGELLGLSLGELLG